MAFWLLALGVFLIDRLTKSFVTSILGEGGTIPVIPGILHITFVLNPGGAFGLLPQGTIFFTLVTLVVFTTVIWYYITQRPRHWAVVTALGLVLGGTAGNLYDRLVIGKVIDWIDFRIFPVFNVADAALVTGLGLISLLILWPGGPLSESGPDAAKPDEMSGGRDNQSGPDDRADGREQ